MTPAPRRVIVISHSYFDPALRGKLRALASRGVEVTVGVPQHWSESVLGGRIDTKWERQGGVEAFPLPVGRGGSGDLTALRYGHRELQALVRDKRPDLIQIEESPLSLAATDVEKTARRAKVPVVMLTLDNVDGDIPWLARRRRRRILTRSRGVIAASGHAAALVRRWAPNVPLAVIPQLGVAVPSVPAHGYHEGLSIGYIGRLVPQKGLDTLLDALAAIRDERWHLTVAGEGPERERLERLATEHRLAARVRWMGALPRDQITTLWPDIDVLVAPSRTLTTWREPVAHTVMEAMAHEVTVVGSDSGVLPEIIGDAGRVVPAGDVNALAQALRDLMVSAARRPLIDAGRGRVMQRFSDDAVAEETIKFWQEALGLSPSRGPRGGVSAG
jgi:glycosyltransferase involved in cell wall biosynthesis